MIITCPQCHLKYDVRAYRPGSLVRCHCGSELKVPAHEVSTVRCPSCGGTVDASSNRCIFCQSLITSKLCPKCGRGVREDAKFCDGCGETLQSFDPPPVGSTNHRCPRCDEPLFSQTVGGFPVEVCDACMGMWIEHGVIENIYADAPKGLTPHRPLPLPQTDTIERSGPKPKAYIPCPECAKMMNPQNYGVRSGVIIDVCREHGVWFDADELNKILQFHANGGRPIDRIADAKKAAKEALQQYRVQEASTRLDTQMQGGGFNAGFMTGALGRIKF